MEIHHHLIQCLVIWFHEYLDPQVSSLLKTASPKTPSCKMDTSPLQITIQYDTNDLS